METHSAIIARIGIRKLARLLGRPHTTVQGWLDRNEIPLKHWSDVVQVSAGEEKPVTVDELMPPELKDVA
jgi:hypothetical protein